MPPIGWDCHCQRTALEFMSLCSSQDGGADVGAWGAEELWGTLQDSTGGLSDHPCPHGSAGEAEGGGPQCGQTAVGLQWKTDFQREPRTEASRADVPQGAELLGHSGRRALQSGELRRWMCSLTSRASKLLFKFGQGVWAPLFVFIFLRHSSSSQLVELNYLCSS